MFVRKRVWDELETRAAAADTCARRMQEMAENLESCCQGLREQLALAENRIRELEAERKTKTAKPADCTAGAQMAQLISEIRSTWDQLKKERDNALEELDFMRKLDENARDCIETGKQDAQERDALRDVLEEMEYSYMALIRTNIELARDKEKKEELAAENVLLKLALAKYDRDKVLEISGGLPVQEAKETATEGMQGGTATPGKTASGGFSVKGGRQPKRKAPLRKGAYEQHSAGAV